jgi:hypothetical protein
MPNALAIRNSTTNISAAVFCIATTGLRIPFYNDALLSELLMGIIRGYTEK